MRGLVVGNLEAATAIGHALGADGLHTTLHRPVHPHDTVEHLRHADYDAIVFLCDGRERPPGAPSDCEVVGRAPGQSEIIPSLSQTRLPPGAPQRARRFGPRMSRITRIFFRADQFAFISVIRGNCLSLPARTEMWERPQRRDPKK